MSEIGFYGLLLLGALLLLLQFLLWQRSGQREDVRASLDPYFRSLAEALARVERELRQEMARTRQEAAVAARGDREEQARALDRLTQSNEQRFEQLRQSVETRLAAIQRDNTEKLESIRLTVDEKLHATLEQRRGDSFRLVSERLEQVHKGQGEM